MLYLLLLNQAHYLRWYWLTLSVKGLESARWRWWSLRLTDHGQKFSIQLLKDVAD
jgi:hypothetical protein